MINGNLNILIVGSFGLTLILQPCKIDSENWTYFRFHFQGHLFRSLIVELATILDKTQVWPRKSFLCSNSLNLDYEILFTDKR